MTNDIELTFSKREDECLEAAMKLLEESIKKRVPLVGYTGSAIDPRASGYKLLVDVIHDKYDSCVSQVRGTGGVGGSTRER